MKYHKDSELSITTKVWNKEIKGLIDYDNTNYTKSKAIVNFPGILSRIDKKVIFTKNKDEQTPFKLLSVDKNEEYGFYNIDCGNWSKDISALVDQGGAFFLFKGEFFKKSRTPKETYYKLTQGDIIKIGKYYMKLLDMEVFDDTDSDDDIRSNSKKTMIRNSSYNSFFVNGQEIIRGAFTPDKNVNQKVNFELSSNNLIGQNESSLSSSNNFFGNKNGNLSFQQKLSFLSSPKKKGNNMNNSNLNKSVKPGFYLPRINSFGELFMIKNKQNLNRKNKENSQNIVKPTIKIKKNKVCRICYGDDSEKDNPLISPCICKGSMKYIHLKCLKNWLNSKIESEMEQSSDNETIIYNTKDLSCELCKAKFPDYVKVNNKLFNISFYKPKFQEFIVFESMKADKNKNKYIYILSFDNRRCINIGRSSECELSIPELSISRFHAIIHKNKGELFIEDNKSKFGTLILVQNNNLKMNDFLSLKLQIKNTYIKIKMKLPFVYSCCIANTNDIFKNDYQSQNHKNLDVFSYLKIKDNNGNDLKSENDEDEKDNDNDIKHKEILDKSKSNNVVNENKEKYSELIEVEKISVEKSDVNVNDNDNNNENSNDNDEKINIINIMSGEIKIKKKSKTVETNKTKKNNNDNSKNNSNQNAINNILISNTEKNKNKNSSNNSNIKKEILKNIINNKEAMECNNYNNSSDNTIKNIEEIKKITNINLIQDNIDNNNKGKEEIKEEEIKDNNKKIIKIMKKIKFKKDEKNIKNKEEYILPNLNNINNKEIENILRNLDFKNSHSIQENTSKALNPISLQDTNLNNISNFNPNQNKSNNKILFNKYNFFQIGSNSFMQNNRNRNNLIDQSESLINPVSFIQKEKSEIEKDESKEK